jgi:hypothetical protein
MKKILKRAEYPARNDNCTYIEVDGELLKKLDSNIDPKTGCYKDCLRLVYWEDETKKAQIHDYYDEFGKKLI